MDSSQNYKMGESAAVIDMEMLGSEQGDESDYETSLAHTAGASGESASFYDDGEARKRASDKDESPTDDLRTNMMKNVTYSMWNTGTQKAKQALNVYANIDILRPYFDVEPHEVRLRLLHSLIPKLPSATQQKVPRELYGPTMLVFTLIALLLFQMKSSEHSVQEGTLMGSAFGVCFGYWLGVSSFVWFLAYICNVHITMAQILSLLGYALFGHCIVLFLSTVFHTGHDHALFYCMWAVFGGLSTLKMISVLSSRTLGQTQKLIICATVTILHMLFLLYLHFAYHKIVEDISAVVDGPVNPAMKQPDAVIDVAQRNLNDPPVLNNPQIAEKLLKDTQAANPVEPKIQNATKVGAVVEQNVRQMVSPGVKFKLPGGQAENGVQFEKHTTIRAAVKNENQILNALAERAPVKIM